VFGRGSQYVPAGSESNKSNSACASLAVAESTDLTELDEVDEVDELIEAVRGGALGALALFIDQVRRVPSLFVVNRSLRNNLGADEDGTTGALPFKLLALRPGAVVT